MPTPTVKQLREFSEYLDNLNPILFSCECGYTRRLTSDKTQMNRVIDHPIYGSRTQLGVACMDRDRHTCELYYIALGKVLHAVSRSR